MPQQKKKYLDVMLVALSPFWCLPTSTTKPDGQAPDVTFGLYQFLHGEVHKLAGHEEAGASSCAIL